MKTEITELLGIRYPIIQGGMAWVADYHLAAAVSNAGGLGLIGSGGAPAEWVREQVREAKKLTDQPFGVNLMLMNPEADQIAKVLVEEGVAVVIDRCRKSGKIYEHVERSRYEGNSGSGKRGVGKENGTLWCGCSCSRRNGSRGTYWRTDYDGTGSANC